MSETTAIDVLFEPDVAMLQHAQAANARLLRAFPKGYALDAAHQPHISCLQRYVKTDKLEDVFAGVSKVLMAERPATWKLTAFKYYYIPWEGLGLAGIVIRPTSDLLAYQQKLIDAVAPFTVPSGTAAAYFTTPENPEIVEPLIEYVAGFVPNQTGKNFSPHVTIGLAPEDYLKGMLAQPFDDFEFSPAAVSVYQLGNYGVAAKKLKGWTLDD
ncbi:MAG: hypothetical protein JO146_02410 [Candidatus Eremiobacteraeota bacterium]|nr:hypothetical protein [Candidatus Eremiobacteraeota bacterium]